MSVWKQGAVPGHERRFSLGVWLPGRNLMSPAYVPSPRARLGLRFKRPVWYVMQFQMTSLQTQYARITVAPNFRLMMIMGTASAASPDAAGAFQVQIYDDARRQNFTPLPVTSLIAVGDAAHPFILKNPYRFTGTAPISARIQNRASVANNVYVALYGVSD